MSQEIVSLCQIEQRKACGMMHSFLSKLLSFNFPFAFDLDCHGRQWPAMDDHGRWPALAHHGPCWVMAGNGWSRWSLAGHGRPWLAMVGLPGHCRPWLAMVCRGHNALVCNVFFESSHVDTESNTSFYNKPALLEWLDRYGLACFSMFGSTSSMSTHGAIELPQQQPVKIGGSNLHIL